MSITANLVYAVDPDSEIERNNDKQIMVKSIASFSKDANFNYC